MATGSTKRLHRQRAGLERFLKVERIADADDVFELGGHSLIAMRMTLLLRRTFKSDVGIEILLEKPPSSASRGDRACAWPAEGRQQSHHSVAA